MKVAPCKSTSAFLITGLSLWQLGWGRGQGIGHRVERGRRAEQVRM